MERLPHGDAASSIVDGAVVDEPLATEFGDCFLSSTAVDDLSLSLLTPPASPLRADFAGVLSASAAEPTKFTSEPD